MSRYATVEVGSDVTVKTYRPTHRWLAERLTEHEVSFYLTVPWATPPLLDYTATTLTVRTLTPAVDYQPDHLLHALLARLGDEGVHHRDVHEGNVVLDDGMPKLIDWEVGIRWPARSYDLHGPSTGVPAPPQHVWRKRGTWGFAHHDL